MKGTKKMVNILVVLVLMFAFTAMVVVADPLGAETVTTESSSTRTGAGGYQLNAIAGNVTELTIDALAVTQFWQGYYGNITGTIVLADSNNNTMYDWSVTEATGEVYASRGSNVVWAGIACASNANMITEEGNIGMTATDVDGINETFTAGTNTLNVGASALSNCPEANLHNATSQKEDGFFDNVVLWDTNSNLVYASIMNNNAVGFDNRPHDFQMLVAENGTNSNTATTNYYFWVELA